MMVKDVLGIALALVVVSGIFVMVKNGTGTAGVLKASADGFATDIRAATGQ
jgi:hypothetical protein